MNGNYGSGTQNAVRAFQASRGLYASGVMDAPTWQALLPIGPAAVKWGPKRTAIEVIAAGRRRVSAQPVPLDAAAPRSAMSSRPPPATSSRRAAYVLSLASATAVSSAS